MVDKKVLEKLARVAQDVVKAVSRLLWILMSDFGPHSYQTSWEDTTFLLKLQSSTCHCQRPRTAKHWFLIVGS